MQKKYEVIDEQFEASKDAMGSYITGFALSILLTVIPYVIVTERLFTRTNLVIWIACFAVAQFLVQVLFFLHLPVKVKPYWNVIVFVFTLLIVTFLVVGTLWIMYHLNVNMMGTSPFNSNEGYIPQ